MTRRAAILATLQARGDMLATELQGILQSVRDDCDDLAQVYADLVGLEGEGLTRTRRIYAGGQLIAFSWDVTTLRAPVDFKRRAIQEVA